MTGLRGNWRPKIHVSINERRVGTQDTQNKIAKKLTKATTQTDARIKPQQPAVLTHPLQIVVVLL